MSSAYRSFYQRLAILLGALLLAAGMTACDRGPTVADVVYLSWDDGGRVQLFRSGGTGAPVQLTGTDGTVVGDVTTFSPSPHGNVIVYSLLLDVGGSEIRRLALDSGRDERLLACPGAECGEFAWAPDNRRLVYERRDLSGPAAGRPQLWWLDTADGETLPLIDDDGSAYGATFSPDGQWLAYVSPQEQGVVVVNLLTGEQQLVPSETGMPPSWSPDSASLVFSNSELVVIHSEEGDDHASHDHDYKTAVHLFVQDVAAAAPPIPLSPDLTVDDSAPVFSPDGEWLVLGRRAAGTAAGRQLWLMRPDGSEARTLTAEDVLQHGAVSWSPDGRWLLYQRTPAFEPAARPSVWIMAPDTGQTREVAPAGFLPRWVGG